MLNSSPAESMTELASEISPVKKSKAAVSLFSYRLMIVYRFALALAGGYALAALSAMFIAQTFAEQRGSAAMSATLAAFTVWAGAFIWVFMVNKTLKATLGIVIPSLILSAALFFLGT